MSGRAAARSGTRKKQHVRKHPKADGDENVPELGSRNLDELTMAEYKALSKEEKAAYKNRQKV